MTCSMSISSQDEECQVVTVANFKKDRFSLLAENLRHTCKEFKQEIVQYMAEEILDFFIQPQGSFFYLFFLFNFC